MAFRLHITTANKIFPLKVGGRVDKEAVMSKYLYLLAIFMMALSSNAFAEEHECDEGKVYNPDLGMCIDETPDDVVPYDTTE